jgi:Lon protease-like protein
MQVRTPYRQARVDFLPYEADLRAPDPAEDFDREPFLSALAPYLAGRGMDIDWDTARAAPQEALVNSLAMALPFDPPEKQALLEALTLTEREAALTALLRIEAVAPDDDEPGPAMQ